MLLTQLHSENAEKLCKILKENNIPVEIKGDNDIKSLYVDNAYRLKAIELSNQFSYDRHKPDREKAEKEKKEQDKDMARKIGFMMGMLR